MEDLDDTPIYGRMIEEVGDVPDIVLEDEVQDLKQMNELLENVVEENNSYVPYRPNRADRRAAAKRANKERKKARG